MTPNTWRQELLRRIERHRIFFSDPTPGRVLVLISPYTFPLDYRALGVAERPLDTWRFPEDAEAFVDRQVDSLRVFARYTRDLDNDHIPGLSASLGIGINSAFLTGEEIRLAPDTSWTAHPPGDWAELEHLAPRADNRWVRLLERMCARIRSRCEGDYVPGTFAHFAPIDLANAVRGDRLFLDFYDDPGHVHALMDRCAEAIIWLERRLHTQQDLVEGGSVVAGVWNPVHTLFLSEDAADLCGPELYTTFARPYTERVVGAIGGAYVHHHSLGLHVHREIARVRGLQVLQISRDPNTPPPIDHLRRLIEWNAGLPLNVECSAADVYRTMDLLGQGRVLLQLHVGSLEEASEAVAFVRRNTRVFP